ncbi:MAG: glycosyltransferase family 2 protein, partial [Tannerellaceae bacterium]
MKRNADISIITVNYNGIKDTLELIESLNQYIRSVIIEIIVVDNASKQDEAALIAARYPDVITIRSEKNLGFAGGNNLGIMQATGR